MEKSDLKRYFQDFEDQREGEREREREYQSIDKFDISYIYIFDMLRLILISLVLQSTYANTGAKCMSYLIAIVYYVYRRYGMLTEKISEEAAMRASVERDVKLLQTAWELSWSQVKIHKKLAEGGGGT